MLLYTSSLSANQKTFLCIGSLVLLNVCIYWQHYLGAASFPGDFRSNYYPLTSFWITLVRDGIFPEWLPYQNIGLPFLMTIQSGVFYPPLWFFAIPGTPEYSLHAANVVQALHVLWGAIGFWIYARSLHLSSYAALLGAIAFHFFGGFYSNSDSADIVRAYAWLPWLFWVSHVTAENETLQLRHWLSPLVVLCVITGSYPGNLTAHAFVLALFLIACWIQQSLLYPARRRNISLMYFRLGGLILLGIGLAAVFLLPVIAMKPLMDRGDGWSGFRVGWMWYYWNTWVMPTTFEGPYVKKTMLSAFVTVPVFCLICLIGKETLVKWMPWCLLALLSLLMAQGNGTPVFDVVTSMWPFLDYSRFPSSDYRGLMCFGIIILSVLTYDRIFVNQPVAVPVKRLLLVCVIPATYLFLFAFQDYIDRSFSQEALQQFAGENPIFAGGIYGAITWMNSTVLSAPVGEWFVYFMFSIALCAGLLFLRRNAQAPHRMAWFFIVITILSGSYMLFRSHDYWSTRDMEQELYSQLQLTQKPSLLQAVKNPPASRPHCMDTMSWRGLLDGSFICVSAGSIISKPWLEMDARPELKSYMRNTWHAMTLNPADRKTCNPDKVIANGKQSPFVRQISYGLQDIHYEINAPENFCFVENEMAFADRYFNEGWSGRHDNGMILKPGTYCKSLRYWCLPAGNYNMRAHYKTPWLREGICLSLVALLLYVVIFLYRGSVRWKHF